MLIRNSEKKGITNWIEQVNGREIGDADDEIRVSSVCLECGRC